METITDSGFFGSGGGFDSGGSSGFGGGGYDFGDGGFDSNYNNGVDGYGMGLSGYDGQGNFGTDFNYNTGNYGFNDNGLGGDSSSDFGGDSGTYGDYSNEGHNYQNPEDADGRYPQEGFLDKLYRYGKKVGTRTIAGAVPGGAQALTAANVANSMQQGTGGSSLGGIAGGMLGSAFGPLGSMGGSALGSWLGSAFDSPNNNTSLFEPSFAQPTRMGDTDFGGIGGFKSYGGDAMQGFMQNITSPQGLGALATGVGSLVSGGRQARDANNTLNSINSLYAPSSPYATQMRQALERKDAAAGRRSQYGTREVELAAALTNARSGQLNGPGYANLLRQRQLGSDQGLKTGMALLQSPAGQAALKSGSGYLQSLFGGGGAGDRWGFGSGSAPAFSNSNGFNTGNFDWAMNNGGNSNPFGDSFNFGG